MIGRATAVALLSLAPALRAYSAEIRYRMENATGALVSEGDLTAGRLSVPSGGSIRFTHADEGFVLLEVAGTFRDAVLCTAPGAACRPLKEGTAPLPIILSSGPGTPIEGSGSVMVKMGKSDGTKAEAILLDFGGEERWWQVTDTFAYAVTRDAGNTAIAGAGVFVTLPRWILPFRKLREQVRYSMVVHLLPPARENDPADLGISPIGFGLFGNRVVTGIGWNVSRRGLRPQSHNTYFYVGFSASQVLRSPR